MFRRTKTDSSQTDSLENKGPGAKGRPTPTRKEAEALRKKRARGAMDKGTAKKVLRDQRAQTNAKVREGMKTGDERYLPARDQGKVKRFIRNYVDARVSIAEFLLPLLVAIMVLQYSGAVGLASQLWAVTLLAVGVDTVWLLFRIKRQIREKFPDESTRGVTFYTMMRAIQLRWLRMPKPRVKIGGAPR